MFFDSISALFSRSIVTTASCPFATACINGVLLFTSRESIAALFSSSKLTTAPCPYAAADASGVRPFQSATSIPALWASSCLAIRSWPVSAVSDSSIPPCSGSVSRLISSISYAIANNVLSPSRTMVEITSPCLGNWKLSPNLAPSPPSRQ